jgi:hypothetical protein
MLFLGITDPGNYTIPDMGLEQCEDVARKISSIGNWNV